MSAPEFSPEYIRVSHNLLGKDISNLSAEKLERYQRMLYDFNMGHYTAATKTPFSSIAVYKSETRFYHPFSIEETFKRYGFNKLEDIIPMETYLKLPACMIDDVIDGITEGKKNRFEADKRAEAELPGDKKQDTEISNLASLLTEVMKQVGKAK